MLFVLFCLMNLFVFFLLHYYDATFSINQSFIYFSFIFSPSFIHSQKTKLKKSKKKEEAREKKKRDWEKLSTEEQSLLRRFFFFFFFFFVPLVSPCFCETEDFWGCEKSFDKFHT